MITLSLSLLGSFKAALNHKPIPSFRTNKVQALLIYLVIEQAKAHRREALMALLWPGMPERSARSTCARYSSSCVRLSPSAPFARRLAARSKLRVRPCGRPTAGLFSSTLRRPLKSTSGDLRNTSTRLEITNTRIYSPAYHVRKRGPRPPTCIVETSWPIFTCRTATHLRIGRPGSETFCGGRCWTLWTR